MNLYRWSRRQQFERSLRNSSGPMCCKTGRADCEHSEPIPTQGAAITTRTRASYRAFFFFFESQPVSVVWGGGGGGTSWIRARRRGQPGGHSLLQDADEDAQLGTVAVVLILGRVYCRGRCRGRHIERGERRRQRGQRRPVCTRRDVVFGSSVGCLWSRRFGIQRYGDDAQMDGEQAKQSAGSKDQSDWAKGVRERR